MTNRRFYILKMPKVPVRANSKSLQYETEFLNEFRANPTGDLFCILCCQTVNCEKPFRVDSLLSSVTSHRQNIRKKLLSTTVNTAEKWQQTFIPILKKNFKSKLVEAFLAADIPPFKLQYPQIRQLFTHLGQSVPSESSCREHVDKLAVDEKQRLNESEINSSKYFNILIGDTAVPGDHVCLGLQHCGDSELTSCDCEDQRCAEEAGWIFRGTILFFCCLMRPVYMTACTTAALSYCTRGSSTLPAWRIFCTTALRKCAATSNKLTISLQKSRR